MKRAIILLLLVCACSRQPAQPARAASLTPEDLGTIGAEIKKSPHDAHRLLAQRGLTDDDFAKAIRKVSEDPAASKRYAAAYHKAGA